MKWLGVFLAFALLDWIWTQYCLAVSRGRAARAAIMSGSVVVVSGLATIAYVVDHWLLVPATLGAVVGTYYAVYYG